MQSETYKIKMQYYQYVFEKTKIGKKVLDYLKDREINLEMAKKFQLGYLKKN